LNPELNHKEATLKKKKKKELKDPEYGQKGMT
jgi:hypothetical protein